MSRLFFFKFEPADWFRDTKCLSFHAKGCWIDLICILWDASPRGKKTFDMAGWSAELGKPEAQIQAAFDELMKRNICYIETLGNGDVTVMSRRQVREEKAREQGASRVQRFRKRHGNGDVNAPVTVESQSQSQNQSQNQSQKKNKKEKKRPATHVGLPALDEFQQIWESYPRKVGKQAAIKAWMKLNGSRPDLSVVLVAVEKYKRSQGWLKDSGEFIPHLSTFLNGKRWEDVIVEVSTSVRPDPPPGRHDPIARGLWKQTYGDPKQYGYN